MAPELDEELDYETTLQKVLTVVHMNIHNPHFRETRYIDCLKDWFEVYALMVFSVRMENNDTLHLLQLPAIRTRVRAAYRSLAALKAYLALRRIGIAIAPNPDNAPL